MESEGHNYSEIRPSTVMHSPFEPRGLQNDKTDCDEPSMQASVEARDMPAVTRDKTTEKESPYLIPKRGNTAISRGTMK